MVGLDDGLGHSDTGGRLYALQLLEQALHHGRIGWPAGIGQHLAVVGFTFGGRWVGGADDLHTKLVYKYKCIPYLDIRQFW